MTPQRDDRDAPALEPLVPPGGMQMIALILVAITLVAVYSNVQRARRGQLETVTIAPALPTPTLPPATITP